MFKIFRTAKLIIKEVSIRWFNDNAPKLAAALSFYTIFSLTPLLIISLAIAGFVFGDAAAHGHIVTRIEDLIGREGAYLIQTALINISNQQTGVIATIISIFTMTIGLTAVFVELKDSLNLIWRVKPEGHIVKVLLKERIISFFFALGIGVLLLASLLASALLIALNDYIAELLNISIDFLNVIHQIISFSLTFFLFSMIYKVLPDAVVKWRDVFRGALVTTVLFLIGKFFISWWLAGSAYSSAYGAAGSLAIFLIWIYYSSMIFFLGAEFTFVYASHFSGSLAYRVKRFFRKRNPKE